MITKRKVSHAVLWSALTVVLMTLLRLGSSVVSSRILQPTDFGVLAFALAMGTLLDQLSFFGVDSALVQKKKVDFIDLDVAWTFEFARKNVLAIILLFLTPVLKFWINDERIFWIVPASCLSLFIASFRNNGVVMFRRKFQFRQIFYLDIFPVILQVLITIIGLMVWPNIAVMVLATLINALALVVVSHLLFDHRPRITWNWQRLKDLLSFGGCLLGNTFVQMIRNQGVTFVLAGFTGTSMLGFFNRGRVFSANIFGQINGLIWRVAYPLFSSKYHSPEGFALPFRSLTAALFFVMPLLMVLYAVIAPDFIPWLLTSKWNASIPFVQLFCIESLLIFLLAPAEIAFQAIGRPVLGTVRQISSCIIFLALIYPLTKFFGVKGIIIASIFATLTMLPFYISKVKDCVVEFSWYTAIRWAVPSCFSALVIWFSYHYVSSFFDYPLMRLLIGSIVATGLYGLVYIIFLKVCSPVQIPLLIEMLPVRVACIIRKILHRSLKTAV